MNDKNEVIMMRKKKKKSHHHFRSNWHIESNFREINRSIEHVYEIFVMYL